MLAETRRRVALSPQYFDFIEAVEFTRKHDDGVCPDGWHDADLLVVGVSRCVAALLLRAWGRACHVLLCGALTFRGHSRPQACCCFCDFSSRLLAIFACAPVAAEAAR